MMGALNSLSATLRRLGTDCSGAIAMMVALTLPIMLGMMAFSIDMSRVYNAQRELQLSTDAAALAGAQGIYDGQWKQLATAYSGTAGQHNVGAIGVTTMVGEPQLKCLSGVAASGVACLGTGLAGGANVIVVKQSVTVGLLFGPILGVDSKTIVATSTAAARGGGRPVNIAIVVDVTGSMSTDVDTGCGITNARKIDCAKKGVLTLLSLLDPNTDKVALLAFPPVVSTGTARTNEIRQTDCVANTGGNTPAFARYDAASANRSYVLVSMTNGYATAPGVLNPTSSIITAASSTRSNFPTQSGFPGVVSATCPGMGTLSGGTYYADAIEAAQKELEDHGTPNGQNAIILLTDGDATGGTNTTLPWNPVANRLLYRCQRAVAKARVAADAGTWLYVIGYAVSDLPSGGTPRCETDASAMPGLSPGLTNFRPCTTLANIAMRPDYTPDDTRFYITPNPAANSQTACISWGAQSETNLATIFEKVANSLKSTRLISNDAT